MTQTANSEQRTANSEQRTANSEQNNLAPVKNKLFYGDNLDILRNKISSESVDLCYIDPPFNSKRNYFQIYNNQGGEDRAQAQAFVDTWEWGDEAVDGIAWITDIAQLQNGKLTEQTVELIKGLEKVLKRGALLAYLVHMTLRIVEIHRVLKPTGSFYLHCDQTASHYLKLLLDSIFCGAGGDLVNEIIWCYRQGGRSNLNFAKKHDTIFWYSKAKTWAFDADDLRVPYEGTGGYQTSGKGVKNGDKVYLPNPLGKIPEDWWDIPALPPMSKERLGYPTQKPEALLERIIKAASTEGDTVLDAYCGCGTTVAVAQRLNRRWIGIDITYQSISLILKRLEDKYPETYTDIEANILLDGVPRDQESAVALANRKDDKTRKEFEKWAVLSYSANRAAINDKKGGDGGVDGIAYFLKTKDENGKLFFSVKSDKVVTPAYVDQLAGTVQREGADLGVLLCLNAPSKGCYARALSYGKYSHELFDREDDKIQIVTEEEMLKGNKLTDWLPMSREVVKSAVAVGDGDKQATLL